MALSDEQADALAEAFIPTWEMHVSGDASFGGDPSAPAVVSFEPSRLGSPKQTLIGTAPVSSGQGSLAEVAEPSASPDAVAKVDTALLLPPVVPQGGVGLGGTLVMPALPAKPPARASAAAPARPVAAVALSADPFGSSASRDRAVVPKTSSKAALLGAGALACAAAVGLFLRSALENDGKSSPTPQSSVTEVARKSEIPPPAPPNEPVSQPLSESTTAHAHAAPIPAPLAETLPKTSPVSPLRSEPKATRSTSSFPTATPQVVQPVQGPVPLPPAPKTPPKPPNGAIVRDNPF